MKGTPMLNLRVLPLAATLAVGGAVLAAAPLAAAKSGPVVKVGGVCSKNSTSKLKLKSEDRGIEVEFEVDQNRNNRTWHVVLKDNGAVFFAGNRMTHAPSGSFSVSKLVANGAGTDSITARAVNQTSGEVCRASVSI
jgi:hypothetical protein